MKKTLNSKKLNSKDLITIGIFTAIYFIISFICMITGGIHAIVWFMLPIITAIFGAVPFMILNAKIKKPFVILLMGTICGLIWFVTGQVHIALPIVYILASLISELIRYISKYKSFWANALCFSIFSLGMAGSPLPLWLDSDSFIKQIEEFGVPDSYIETIEKLTSISMFFVMLVGTIIAGFIGAFIAKALFKKHFKKAGIIS